MIQYPFIIVEDVALQREYLSELLSSRLELSPVGTFDNAEEAYEFLASPEERKPALIFLDIEMPEASGFNLLESLRNLRLQCKVIITTAFAEYAVKGYEYGLSGYLLKPIEPQQLNKAVDRAIQELQAAGQDKRSDDQYLLIKEKGRWVRLQYDEILYLEGANVDVRIITQGGTFLTRDRIKNLAQALPSALFLRVHDSFIVNLSHVKAYASNYSFMELCPGPGEALVKLPVGPKYRPKVKEQVSTMDG